MKVMLDKMILIAATEFAGKFDEGGKPYILHCLKVMEYLQSDDDELNSIAVGHDLFEDTNVTYNGLLAAGFTYRVVEGIRRLTKQGGESAEEYLTRVKGSHDAVLVNLADLRHHSDIRRLKGITDKDIDRMKKYHAMYLDLQSFRKQEGF